MVQKCCRVLWAKAHLKWTVSKWKSVLWSDESKFYILVGNHGHRVLRAKEEGELPACYQCSVQKPASLMVWGCISAYGMGSLHVLEGTMNAESYIKALEQHMLREVLVYFSRTMNSSAAGNLYQARMGPNSNTKTPETHNLDAQTSSDCLEKKRRCYTMINMPPSQLFWDL